jgi:prepilin peptidase CpaA
VSLSPQCLALFWIPLFAACAFDVASRRVPNWLTVGMLCAGLAARACEGGMSSAAWGLAGAVCGPAVLFYPFTKRWVGGGDVKLLAAMGASLGPAGALWTTLAASVAGGALVAVHLLRTPAPERREIATNLKLAFFIRRLPELPQRAKEKCAPYSLALATGAMVVCMVGGPHVFG